jgi:hypothetical protein
MGGPRSSYKKMSAVTVALLMGMVSCAWLVVAHEEGEPLVITIPEGIDPIPVAVYFADNMVYAPQWRIDNLVRIETMIINTTDYECAQEIHKNDTDLYPYPGLFENGTIQQRAILDDPTILNLTRMVSVSYIEISMYNSTSGALADRFDAGWDPVTLTQVIDGGVGREVNKAGHLIYGMLWDTTGLFAGVYTVKVRLGHVEKVAEEWTPMIDTWYEVTYAVANWYDPEAEEGTLMDEYHPYHDLVLDGTDEYAMYGIGVGGISGRTAWIDLGQLIAQGPGGGSGGDSGNDGEGGNGNGTCGANSGGNGWSGDRVKRK